MSKRKEEANANDDRAHMAIEDLPLEVLTLVLQCLDPVALLQASRVNYKWRALSQPEWPLRDELLVGQGGYEVARQIYSHFDPVAAHHFYQQVKGPTERVLRFHSAATFAQSMEQTTTTKQFPELWTSNFCDSKRRVVSTN